MMYIKLKADNKISNRAIINGISLSVDTWTPVEDAVVVELFTQKNSFDVASLIETRGELDTPAKAEVVSTVIEKEEEIVLEKKNIEVTEEPEEEKILENPQPKKRGRRKNANEY